MGLEVAHPSALAVEVFPAADPLRALADLPGAFVLRSSLPDTDASPRRARWTLFGADPFASFRAGDTSVAVQTFRAIAASAPANDAARELGVPFAGGAVGYWAYDYGRRLERLPTIARDDLGLPDFVMSLYDVTGAHDHDSGRTWLFSTGLPAGGRAIAQRRASERLNLFRARLESPPRVAPPRPPARVPRTARSTFTADGYRRAVEDVREAIRRGDIFQANLSQRWHLPLPDAHTHARGVRRRAARRTRPRHSRPRCAWAITRCCPRARSCSCAAAARASRRARSRARVPAARRPRKTLGLQRSCKQAQKTAPRT